MVMHVGHRRRGVPGLLDGVIAASLGLMALVTWHLARAAIVDPYSALLGALVLAALLLRVNSAWLVIGGAAAGLLLTS